ncbi:MAG: zinc ribbon domain-containing protein [Ruminococcus sp.]|nr:zinc ribbon domain-containing protein [Ruminococcus sp.]
MKTFWDDFSKKIGETADTVSAKANEVVELQKIKSQIRTLERNNDNDYIELGKMIYDKFKAGEAVAEEEKGFCEAIQSREESIAEYLQKMVVVKGDVECDVCGKIVSKGMSYCPYCGAKAAKEDIVDKVEDIVEEVKEKAEEAVEKAAEKVEEILD